MLTKSLVRLTKECRFGWKRYLHQIHVAVVGSGPSGFYAAQYLLKNANVKVDIFEKFPVPFGLIRYGVAPDHQDVKNVIHSFTTTGLNQRVCFFGNVSIGIDVTLDELRKAYHAVVLCYGTAQDRKLDVEGENLPNVFSARRFVGWYNGVPHDADLNVNLDTEDVVVVGQGNVALDCARILLAPPEKSLEKTDITSYSIEKLKKSRVKKVHLVGRRGVLQVSFTIAEFRQLTQMENCFVDVPSVDEKIADQEFLTSLPRPRRRLTELLIKQSRKTPGGETRICSLKFLRIPVKINGDETSGVKSVTFALARLEDDCNGHVKAVPTDVHEEIPCGMVLKSIGYKAVRIDPTIPMDDRTGIIDNIEGRVQNRGPGLYCSGWAATGATGVVLSTMNNSFAVAQNILKDIEQEPLSMWDRGGSAHILHILHTRGVKPVEFSDWLQIDKLERERGEKVGKLREKIVQKDDMLNAIKKS